MSAETPVGASFLLIDGALAGQDVLQPLAGAARPAWMLPLYQPEAEALSPFVIDIAAAFDAGDFESVMSLWNAVQPQLHVSIIDTTLSHADLAQHLRHFIMIRTGDGNALTLRFADCLVLPALADALAPDQWRALTGPMVRWRVHGRDGALTALPPADADASVAPTPLVLAPYQLAVLEEWMAPDAMVAHLRAMHPGEMLPGTAAEQHQWAHDARAQWWMAPHADALVLRWLTMAAFETRGEILGGRHLRDILALTEPGAIRAGLRSAVGRCRAGLTLVGP